MKKLLLTTIATGLGLSAFGQGGVIIANGNNSSAHWNLNTSSGPAAPIGTDVQLLWYNGTSFQIVGSVLTTTVNNAGTFNNPAPGGLYFIGTTTTQIPTYTPVGTFEVQGWTGGYANYAAAAAGSAYVGETASFTTGEADIGGFDPGTPHGLPNGLGQINSTWNGDLVLTVPEPSTIALDGLGVFALWSFRRRK